jgi:hypothetical protein
VWKMCEHRFPKSNFITNCGESVGDVWILEGFWRNTSGKIPLFITAPSLKIPLFINIVILLLK